MDYEIQFSLAGLNMMLHMPHGIIINESFQPFVTESADEPDIHIRIYEEESMNFTQAFPVCVKIPFSVYKDRSGYYRVFHDRKESNMPYATGKILSDTEEEIHYLKKRQTFFNESQNTFSHIALEDLLLRRDAVVLHASYIDTVYGGILFSGASGIGKSTQADLWCRYRNAKQVNGDRPILRRDKSGWKAYGSPYAGSSRCWLNRSSQIRAIVILGQGTECCIRKMDKAAAFRKLYEGMIVNVWNDAYVERILSITEELAMEVPVYQMICTPDERAISELEYMLKGEL